MTSGTRKQALEIFQAALELDEDLDWPSLEAACANNTDLMVEVRRLYEADQAFNENTERTVDERAGYLRTQFGLLGIVTPHTVEDRSGSFVGGYELISHIGGGGMGEVYRARNTAAGFEHDVALKLVRTTAAKPETQQLFETERMLLAQLKHPNIAALYDGGATEGGMLYFVLELVQGQKIDDYCDAQSLSVDQIVDLVLTVCAAVQYAHAHLIIHRDIKPGNVLVDDQGSVKLLDFGIAKQLTADSMPETHTVQTPFTPDYASPEQLLGTQVSTASDVYSLGVLLFKLLTGRLPHEVRTAAPAQMVEIASRSTAPLASDKIAEEKLAHRHLLKGDLDNILSKALEKNTTHRYQSVQEFAEDLRRYRQGLPVTARINSWNYRARKFLSRHAIAVTTSFTVAFALIVVTLFSVQQLGIAREERDRATRTNNFLKEVITSPASTWTSRIEGGRDLKVVDLLNQLPAEIKDRFREDPAQQLELLVAVGSAQFHNNDIDKAKATVGMAADLADCCVTTPSETHVGLLHLQWIIERELGLDTAGQYIERAVVLLDELRGSETLLGISMAVEYGLYLFQSGELERAERYMDRAIAMNSDPQDDDRRKLQTIALGNRALLAMKNGKMKQALSFINRSISMYETTTNALTIEHAASLYNRSYIKRLLGQYASAATDNENAIAEIEEIGGSVAMIDLLFGHHLALVYLRLGDSAQAEHYLQSAEDPKSFTTFDIRKRTTKLVRGELALVAAQYDQAERYFEDGLALYAKNETSPDETYALLNSGLALARYSRGDAESAVGFAETASSAIRLQMEDEIAIVRLIEARQRCLEARRALTHCLIYAD